jgi:hypothetical protein
MALSALATTFCIASNLFDKNKGTAVQTVKIANGCL